jgi:hypothetical protein
MDYHLYTILINMDSFASAFAAAAIAKDKHN